MHQHEHEAVTGCVIELCVLALQASALSLLMEVCLADCFKPATVSALGCCYKTDIFLTEARFSKTCQQSRHASGSSATKSTQHSSRTPILLNTHRQSCIMFKLSEEGCCGRPAESKTGSTADAFFC